MQLETSKILESKQKPNEPQNDIIGIRYIPLPAAQREAYQVAIRLLAKLLIEIVNEEHSQVNTGMQIPCSKSTSQVPAAER